MPFFPWNWGSASVATASPLPPVPPLWVNLTAFATAWAPEPILQIVPRFEHLYPQTPPLDQHVDFILRVQNQFPLILKTGNEDLILSHITNMPQS